MSEIIEIDDIERLDELISDREVALDILADQIRSDYERDVAVRLLEDINRKIAEIDKSQVINRSNTSSFKEEAAKLEASLQKTYADLDDEALF